MIPNHTGFIEAIHQRKKVNVRFYSKADSGVLDRVCAPLDYGPGGGQPDGMNRYWFWDYGSNTGTQTLGLVPQQIVDVQVLGEVFNPADFGVRPSTWSIPRDWGSTPQPLATPAVGPTQLAVAARAVGGQAQRTATTPANTK